ncbi:YbhB/YbcL family Raf kinase inhibitor-like protein [Dyella choica]|uniref:YbhB/YbcL family Raf kinase inhibitor-like protein n=1 Tax=Dyella choica TaxID=1927959 RepID=A0A432M8Z2_9GAMM|nr:YbhB/YbcL family Raf kinase inhibitor-like protein [Dyella choica]RUL78344.1 YbhB/YbcL family Raf kinase inhibitor-like protein [Dyella choica]
MMNMRSFIVCSIALLMAQAAMAGTGPMRPLLRVSSSSFADGGQMPARLTCDGANLSPEIRFATPPAGTRSFAIVVDDQDVPVEFFHWLAYGIPADTRELPEGASTPSQRLAAAAEGINNFGRMGYGGPCPPAGATHHYVFHVYALDDVPALPSGASAQEVNTAIRGHVLAEGRFSGVYARGGD